MIDSGTSVTRPSSQLHVPLPAKAAAKTKEEEEEKEEEEDDTTMSQQQDKPGSKIILKFPSNSIGEKCVGFLRRLQQTETLASLNLHLTSDLAPKGYHVKKIERWCKQ